VRSACDHRLTGPSAVAAQSMDAIRAPISPPSRKRSSVRFERALFTMSCARQCARAPVQRTLRVEDDRASASPPSVRSSGFRVLPVYGAEVWKDLPLVELEESLLFLADLMDTDVIESRLGVLLDRGELARKPIAINLSFAADAKVAERFGHQLKITARKRP